MNKLVTCFMCLFCLVFCASSSVYSIEPDESGIGGTGISAPPPTDDIFNRPDIPEIVDSPELPEHALPDTIESIDGAADTPINDIPVPTDTDN